MTETWLTCRSALLETDDEEKKILGANRHTHTPPRVCRKRGEVGNARVLAAVAFDDGIFLRCESALVREMKQGHTCVLFLLFPFLLLLLLFLRTNDEGRRRKKKRSDLCFLFISLITAAPLSHPEGVYEAQPLL